MSLFHAILFLGARFGVVDITTSKPMDFQIISLLPLIASSFFPLQTTI
jgi:hypothetical protein